MATIAAHVAATTPGVARVVPPPTRRLRNAAAAALLEWPPRAFAADGGSVEIDRPAGDAGQVTVTVRLVATGRPSVLATVGALHVRIRDVLDRVSGLDADVHLLVVAVDPMGGSV